MILLVSGLCIISEEILILILNSNWIFQGKGKVTTYWLIGEKNKPQQEQVTQVISSPTTIINNVSPDPYPNDNHSPNIGNCKSLQQPMNNNTSPSSTSLASYKSNGQVPVKQPNSSAGNAAAPLLIRTNETSGVWKKKTNLMKPISMENIFLLKYLIYDILTGLKDQNIILKK